eukprot:tig00001484_g8910.t1
MRRSRRRELEIYPASPLSPGASARRPALEDDADEEDVVPISSARLRSELSFRMQLEAASAHDAGPPGSPSARSGAPAGAATNRPSSAKARASELAIPFDGSLAPKPAPIDVKHDVDASAPAAAAPPCSADVDSRSARSSDAHESPRASSPFEQREASGCSEAAGSEAAGSEAAGSEAAGSEAAESARQERWERWDEGEEAEEGGRPPEGAGEGPEGAARPACPFLSLSDDLIVALLSHVEPVLRESAAVRALCALRLVCRRFRDAVDAAGGAVALASALRVPRGGERLAGLVLRRPGAFGGLREAEIEAVRWDPERVFRALLCPDLLASLRLSFSSLACLESVPRRCPHLRQLALHLSSAEEADMAGPLGAALAALPLLESLELGDARLASWGALLAAAPVLDLSGLEGTPAGAALTSLSLRGPLAGHVASLAPLAALPRLASLSLSNLGPGDPPAPAPPLALPALAALELAEFECWTETAVLLVEQLGAAPRPFAEQPALAARLAAALRRAPRLRSFSLTGDPDGGKPEVEVLAAALACPLLEAAAVVHAHPHSANPLPYPRIAGALAAAAALGGLEMGTSDATALDALAALPPRLRHLALRLGPDAALWAAALEAAAAALPALPALCTLRLAPATRETALIMARWRPEGEAEGARALAALAAAGVALSIEREWDPSARARR